MDPAPRSGETVVEEARRPGAEAGGVDVKFERVSKRFGDSVAVDGVDLEIMSGEFFSLLGPSGSGKTTCLRMIAGFERPTEGRIVLHGRDVSGLPPYDRDVNTVFQDYALFPHMTVAENVEYGLKVKRVAKGERSHRVADSVAMVQLEGFERRKPAALSGGQRQRVALARALVNRPRVLLLDEPLGALDLKLRQEMQVELKAIQQEVGITFVYVTHDQEEALTMSDRLAVMSRGKIEQVGSPAEVYESPASAFVADFVGISNLIDAATAARLSGTSAACTLRPEKIRMVERSAAPEPGEVAADGRVEQVVYLGSVTRYHVELDDGGRLIVTAQNLSQSSTEALEVQGKEVRLLWSRDNQREVCA